MSKCLSPQDAVALIRSGTRVFVQGAAAVPRQLVSALAKRKDELHDVEIIHLHTEGAAPYAEEACAKSFRVCNLFVGGNIRKQMDCDRVDYLPCFLSEIPSLFRSGNRRPDVALVQLSPPDKNGYCSLGTSVDVARAAVDTAQVLIAQINPRVPRVHGDGFVHIDEIDAWIEVDEPLAIVQSHPPTEAETHIGRQIASLVQDGSTLQMGIGSIPNAAAMFLMNHKNLGVHTEMWSDGLLPLLKAGVVTNSLKKVHAHKTVSSFVLGSQELYDFIDDNPQVIQLGADYVNNPAIIARNPKVVAINSAVEVDLTGQVCADSVGFRIISGVGGQMDFIRGASLSEGGCPIIAVTSRSAKGQPKIVPLLKHGAGVVTTRAHTHYVVTEYGIANLYGRTLGERARALIAIAHPDDREDLSRKWHDLTTGKGSTWNY